MQPFAATGQSDDFNPRASKNYLRDLTGGGTRRY